MPREKLLQRGPEALSDAELLALILRTGMMGKNVLELAQELLDGFGGVAGLLHLSQPSLEKVKGLGPAKRAELMAVMALARRGLSQQIRQRPLFDSPSTVMDYLRLHMGHLPYEVFSVLFLDSQHQLVAMEDLFRGTLTQTAVYPREVVIRALHHHAAAVVLAHNHPSGVPEPSNADQSLTQQLKQTLALVDVRVLDHIVVTLGRCTSMAERGMV
mgnify:CR=1 FL=1